MARFDDKEADGFLKKLFSGKYDTVLRRVWYLLLFAAGGVYVALNWRDITQAGSIGVGQVVAIVWLVLLLLPLFTEMELFGFKFKREVEKLEKKVDGITLLMTANAQATSNAQANTYVLMRPELSQDERQKLEKEFRSAAPVQTPGNASSEEDKLRAYLYSVKLSLDDVLKRVILQSDIDEVRDSIAYDDDGNAVFPANTKYKLLHALQKRGDIDNDVYRAVREIYLIVNRATHGEDFDIADVGFVEATAPHCLRVLENYCASLT